MTSISHHGKNLRNIRLLRGMKQEAFAHAMGISQQRVSKIEKQRVISETCRKAAANVLNVSIDAFDRFDEDGLLYLAAEAKPKDDTRSVKEVIDYFKEELSKKDRRIEELESRLNLNNSDTYK